MDNLSSEEVHQLQKEYIFGCLLEEIQESTSLYDFALNEIETHLFLSESLERDILNPRDEDLHDVLKRPALIFQLGMERDPVDVVGILRCVKRWAEDNCKRHNGEKYGLYSFLNEIFNEESGTPQSVEEWERLSVILCVPDLSDPPPGTWKSPR